MKTPKCQAKEHSGRYGCSSPRCPEGLYVQKVIGDALKNKDVSAYIEARQLQDRNKKIVSIEKGVATLKIDSSDDTGKSAVYVTGPIDRDEIRAQLTAIDKSKVPSFESIHDLSEHVRSLYEPYLNISVDMNDSSPYGWKHVHVYEMDVEADLRSTGMGYHVRRMLSKFCDEHDAVLSGTPTNGGDRSYNRNYVTQVTPELHKENAIRHKKRLEGYYLRSGYMKNYAYSYADSVDYHTGLPHEQNDEWRAQFNEKGEAFIAQAGEFIRFPKGKIPNSMLAGKIPRKVKVLA